LPAIFTAVFHEGFALAPRPETMKIIRVRPCSSVAKILFSKNSWKNNSKGLTFDFLLFIIPFNKKIPRE
jgi:hypothetical protein